MTKRIEVAPRRRQEGPQFLATRQKGDFRIDQDRIRLMAVEHIGMAVQELGEKGGAGAGVANNEYRISGCHTVVFSSA